MVQGMRMTNFSLKKINDTTKEKCLPFYSFNHSPMNLSMYLFIVKDTTNYMSEKGTVWKLYNNE